MSKYLIIPHKEDLGQSLELAKKYDLGFEFNDFFWPDVLDDTAKQEEIIETYGAVEMPKLLTSHGAFFDVLVFSLDRKITAVSEARVRESLDIAKRMGAGKVIFHTNYEPLLTQDYYRKSWRERTAAFYRKVCAEYPDLLICMENMFDDAPYELESVAALLKDVPNFGVCLDYAHACVFGHGVDTEEWVKTLAPYIRHVHINDNDGKDDLHLAVGEGVTDWNRFLTLRAGYFPEATVLVETTPLERQVKSLEYMNEHGFFTE